jgi:hypothetical protein
MGKLFSVWLLVCASAFAQFETATVFGTIRDSTGAVISGSKVTLLSATTGTQQVTTTDGNGEYQFLNVRAGEFTLKAESVGFKVATAEKFAATVNARQRVDLSLEVGQATENVVVSGAAALLETDSSERSQVIESREVLNLPLNGRSYADLTLLVPGVRNAMLLTTSTGSGANPTISSWMASTIMPSEPATKASPTKWCRSHRTRCRNTAWKPPTTARSTGALREP